MEGFGTLKTTKKYNLEETRQQEVREGPRQKWMTREQATHLGLIIRLETWARGILSISSESYLCIDICM